MLLKIGLIKQPMNMERYLTRLWGCIMGDLDTESEAGLQEAKNIFFLNYSAYYLTNWLKWWLCDAQKKDALFNNEGLQSLATKSN